MFFLSQWRVALLGIAHRQISVKDPSNLKSQKQARVLESKIKTIGDWLKFKRIMKNLTPGHIAAKMGIAPSLVCSWESSAREPDGQQLKVLLSVLEFDARDFETITNNLANFIVACDNWTMPSCDC
jgi:DNA-binding transcriptional regulator YiaG